MTTTIVALDDYPQHLDTVVRWVWNEWRGGQNGNSYDATRAVMKGKRGAPPTLVALDERSREPIGVLGFQRVLFDGRDPLVLFVNSLFVAPNERGRGIASALLAEAVRRVGPDDDWLYVYTQIAGWYEARGFTAIEREAATGSAVLRRQITRQAS